jgi:hypothetical protein
MSSRLSSSMACPFPSKLFEGPGHSLTGSISMLTETGV